MTCHKPDCDGHCRDCAAVIRSKRQDARTAPPQERSSKPKDQA